MINKMVDDLASAILSLDERDLTAQLAHYKKIMEDFQPTKEWEKAVIAFFLINGVRIKNHLWQAQIQKKRLRYFSQPDQSPRNRRLRVVK